MASPFLWPVLMPYAHRTPVRVNLKFWHHMKRLWLYLSIAILSMPAMADYEYREVIQTRYGPVRLGRTHPALSNDLVLFNKKILLKRFAEFVSIQGPYRLQDLEVILVKSSCGGSSCGPAPLWFVMIGPKGHVKVVTKPDFYSATISGEPEMKDGRLVMDLGFENGKSKTATLDRNGTLAVHYGLSRHSMSLSDCGWLYEYTVNNCQNYRELKLGCTGGPVGSGSEMTQNRFLSELPGYSKDAVNSLCMTVCQTGDAVPFQAFKEQACGL